MESEKGNGSSLKKPKRTAAPSAKKKKVVDLHLEAYSLVGRIVEKGFSPSGEPHRNPSAAVFTNPTLLPFPLARHRSHGPHWTPTTSEPDAGDDPTEDDVEYNSISSFANPIDRKEKKGLNLSRWREIISAPPNSKKNEAKPTNGKEGTMIISHTATTTSSGSDALGCCDSLLPVSSISEPASRVAQMSVLDDAEFNEVDTNGRRVSSPMDDIDEENRSRLEQMSSDEIAEAQSEIMEKMDPSIVEMLKKRGLAKLGTKKGLPPTRDKERKELRVRESVGRSSKTVSDGLSSGGPDSSSWEAWRNRVEKVRDLRFSLDGDIVGIEQQANGNKSVCSQYNVDNVAERDFLRTEGDPAAVGYTIKEAVALIRSMVPGQRTLALQLLAFVFHKASHNLQSNDIGSLEEKINPADKLIDWQAVWAFALGPEPDIALSLRIALDDNHNSVVFACAKVIQCILSCDANENIFNIKEKLPTHDKDICTAPVFRSKPEAHGGFLHGGFWKYSTKSSNILPCNNVDVEDEDGNPTIRDDVVVAEQDVAAGLVRMGILHRICYLLEIDPIPTLEECLVSLLIALARHSPTCANAIMSCPKLIQTVSKIFIKQGTVEIHPSQIKAVVLLKVLSKSNKEICLDFVKSGVFQQAMWHWYRNAFTLDLWIKSGREQCKFTSSMMVEQLRLWKVCIRYGYCITYFVDIFPAMCLWLIPPTFDKLIENNILCEFASITREAYIVLEALARGLPTLHSVEQLDEKATNSFNDDVEVWSWSHAVPMVDIAISWLSLKEIPHVSSVISYQYPQASSASCLLWVISAVLHMLCSVFDKIAPEDMDGKNNSSLPWLPQFVPKVGLEIIKNGFLGLKINPNFSTRDGSLVEGLCHLGRQNDCDVSLSSVSCLHGLVKLAFSLDKTIQRARSANSAQLLEDYRPEIETKILAEGIMKWAQKDLLKVLAIFVTLVSSEWHVVQSVEMFGRGGPAPGIGIGWGTSGGGFWSVNVLLAQMDSKLILDLLKIFNTVLDRDPAFVERMQPVDERNADSMVIKARTISSIIGICLIVGPGDQDILEKALDVLLEAHVLKYLSLCIQQFVRCFKSVDWQYEDDDYLFFSKTLNSHFRDRWLSGKSKLPGKVDRDALSREGNRLETIQEDLKVARENQDCNSLLIEWAHQRLPLPLHWFLSAIMESSIMHNSNDILDCARSGLFFLLGLESMSSLLGSDSQDSPISGVPLVWKLHALSVSLHADMDALEDQKSRDVLETLQEVYGEELDKLRMRDPRASLDSNKSDVLDFQAQVHESYTTFVENLVEQFAAVSYGDIAYGRQITLYLHRCSEAAVRLATWNALSNARVLELLPSLEKCIAEGEGYLEPAELNVGILEAYAKSWTSGSLDRVAARGWSVGFTLALHHLSCFVFGASDKSALRNKLVRSLLRSYSQKQHHQGMMLDLVQYKLPILQGEAERRLQLLKEACEGNSSLLVQVEKLKSSLLVQVEKPAPEF